MTQITNTVAGLISGPAASAIYTYEGALALNNFGKIQGGILCTASDRDVVINHGLIAGPIHLGPGNDKYDGLGGTAGKIFGEAGSDRLVGGNNANWFIGGTGGDSMTGRAGADRFALGSYLDSPVGPEHDVITDFRHGQHDHIDLVAVIGGVFVFRGQQGFLGGGMPSVRYDKLDLPGTANDKTMISGDYDGNGVADFQIELTGLINLVQGDFFL